MTSLPNYNLYCDTRLGGIERWSIGLPEDAKMRIPDEILQAVCFLCIKDTRQSPSVVRYGGTGFFVSIPSETNPDAQYSYLITARHCVERAKPFGGLYLRVNALDGDAKLVEVQANWWYPEDAAADVAVLPWAPDSTVFEYKNLPLSMFVTDERIDKHGIGVGDDLVVTGLFTQHSGRQRNQPIVRTGIIAAMPNEPFEDENTGLSYNAYLAEVRSIGGLSGSPVFVVLGPGRTHKGKINMSFRFLLLGLIRGHWDYKRAKTSIDFSKDELEQVNMGIGLVTPIHEALKIIHGADLLKMRQQNDRKISLETAPTKD